MVKKKDVNENAAPDQTEAASQTADEPTQLTDDQVTAIFEQLTPDRLELAAAFVEVLHRQESRERVAAGLDRYEQRRQGQLREAERLAASDLVDDVERMSLFVIGHIALDFHLTRASTRDGGLESLFNTVNGALREALTQVETSELECIAVGEREKREKMAAAVAATASLSEAQYVKGGADDDEETA